MNEQLENTSSETDEDAVRSIRVAVVEDDANLRLTLETFVNRTQGLECVASFGSAEQALDELSAHRPDVVLMDIRLPGMSGIECVERLGAIVPQAKALMLTAYEEADDVFQSLAAGAFGYLLKSAEPARLREAIREVHLGGSPISGSVARKIVDRLRIGATTETPATKDQTRLSPREVEILHLLAAGHAYKQIAAELGCTINTIRTHIKRIYEKLHAHNRTEAVRKFQNRGGR